MWIVLLIKSEMTIEFYLVFIYSERKQERV